MKASVTPIRPGIEIDYSLNKRRIDRASATQSVRDFMRFTGQSAMDAVGLYFDGGKDFREAIFPKTTQFIGYFRSISLGVVTSIALTTGLRSDTSNTSTVEVNMTSHEGLEKKFPY